MCTCFPGYQGDGLHCQGEYKFLIKLIIMLSIEKYPLRECIATMTHINLTRYLWFSHGAIIHLRTFDL